MKISARVRGFLLLSLTFALWPASAQSEAPHAISHEIVGRKVWVNECDGTVAGLTSWNADEAFPSLGIGHFIWYPAGKGGLDCDRVEGHLFATVFPTGNLSLCDQFIEKGLLQ